MKRILITTAVAALLALPVFAQGGPGEDQQGEPGPRAQVARFLELSDIQIEAWEVILSDQRDQIQPLAEQMRAAEQALGELIKSDDPSADAVGTLVLEISGLRSDIGGIHRASVEAFEALLETEQADRLGFVRAAARVQPVIPAFRAAGLVGRGHGPGQGGDGAGEPGA